MALLSRYDTTKSPRQGTPDVEALTGREGLGLAVIAKVKCSERAHPKAGSAVVRGLNKQLYRADMRHKRGCAALDLPGQKCQNFARLVASTR